MSLVDASTKFESLPEGEQEVRQQNRGQTIATETPVREVAADGRPNAYYEAFSTMRRLCLDDYDIVFATSFGF
eukprot:656532-Prymnesium_polylepis.1